MRDLSAAEREGLDVLRRGPALTTRGKSNAKAKVTVNGTTYRLLNGVVASALVKLGLAEAHDLDRWQRIVGITEAGRALR